MTGSTDHVCLCGAPIPAWREVCGDCPAGRPAPPAVGTTRHAIERLVRLSALVEASGDILTAERDHLIRDLRRRGLTLRQLADATGLTPQRIAQIERGTR